jgi:hypothetical protein
MAKAREIGRCAQDGKSFAHRGESILSRDRAPRTPKTGPSAAGSRASLSAVVVFIIFFGSVIGAGAIDSDAGSCQIIESSKLLTVPEMKRSIAEIQALQAVRDDARELLATFCPSLIPVRGYSLHEKLQACAAWGIHAGDR